MSVAAPYEKLGIAYSLPMRAKRFECWISSAAMDGIAGKRGLLPVQREARFLELREEIERIASEIFDGDTIGRGAVVRVFAKPSILESRI